MQQPCFRCPKLPGYQAQWTLPQRNGDVFAYGKAGRLRAKKKRGSKTGGSDWWLILEAMNFGIEVAEVVFCRTLQNCW